MPLPRRDSMGKQGDSAARNLVTPNGGEKDQGNPPQNDRNIQV